MSARGAPHARESLFTCPFKLILAITLLAGSVRLSGQQPMTLPAASRIGAEAPPAPARRSPIGVSASANAPAAAGAWRQSLMAGALRQLWVLTFVAPGFDALLSAIVPTA